jgi:hypothetical protein
MKKDEGDIRSVESTLHVLQVINCNPDDDLVVCYTGKAGVIITENI